MSDKPAADDMVPEPERQTGDDAQAEAEAQTSNAPAEAEPSADTVGTTAKTPTTTPVPDRAGPAARAWLTRSSATAWRLVREHRIVTALAAVVVVVLVVTTVRACTHHEGPGWARSPAQAVQGYLEAVAKGRAADALAYVDRAPYDRTFLTDEVLAESRKLAPMTAITVQTTHSDNLSAQVKATYRLAGKTQTEVFSVEKGRDHWFVETTPVSLEFKSYRDILAADVPIFVNGVELRSGSLEVPFFPGQYQVTTTHRFVELDTTVTVGAPDWYRDSTKTLPPPVLTGDARARVAEAAQARLDGCLAQPTFATDCAFFDGGEFSQIPVPADPQTISWSWPDATALPGPPAAVERLSGVVVTIDVHLVCTWTDETGQAQSAEPYRPLVKYVADLTDPDNITIIFSRS
ncbi:MAG: hypothetical protein FWF02_02245 [Micrococcales bacterium]|nr:hypothetical protein [Micrococcales bacterium]